MPDKVKLVTTVSNIELNFDVWLANSVANEKAVKNSTPLSKLIFYFKDEPIIVVCPGPNLDKNILYLNKFKKYGRIICVDMALKPLLKAGIIPDLIVSIDSSPKVLEMYKDLNPDSGNVYIAVSTVVNPELANIYKGQVSFFTLKIDNKKLDTMYPELPKYKGGATVAHTAIILAQQMGASHILLAGYDFAVSNGKYYCNNVIVNNLIDSENGSIDEGICTVNNHKGLILKSTLKLTIFWDYVKKLITDLSSTKRIFNLTEGGLLFDNSIIVNTKFRHIFQFIPEPYLIESKRKAYSYENTGEFKKAVNNYILLIKNNFLPGIILKRLIQLLTLHNELDYGIKTIQTLVPEYINTAPAWYMLGLIYRNKLLNTEAVSCFKKALELNPEFADTYLDLGLLLLDEFNLKNEAVYCLNEYLKFSKNEKKKKKIKLLLKDLTN